MPRGYGRFNIMSSIAASTVVEGAGKPVRRLNMSTTDIAPSKGVAQIVFTRELLDGLDAANALASIRRELTRSIVEWTDSVLLTSLSGNSNDTQGTDSVSDFLTVDFEELLQLVGASSQSSLWLVVTPAIAKSIAAHLVTLGVNVPSWNLNRLIICDCSTEVPEVCAGASDISRSATSLDLTSTGDSHIATAPDEYRLWCS